MHNKAFLKYVFDDELYVINEAQRKVAQGPNAEYSKTEEAEKKEKQVMEKTWPISFKGQNAKNIIILVNYPAEKHISNQDEQFLLKILSAVSLSLQDVAIINLAKNECSIDRLKDFNSSIVLLFGEFENIPGLSNYEIKTVEGIKFQKANSLREIQNNVPEKKLLWSNLQKLFL
ncbi:MAG: hypothetical protein RLO81_02815 [Fulvivirga sp.]|uniref:hypothetical protein n=1 Tax=Fulvivirga sp. TaxID=1931237 RepID=UPI0032ECE961